MKKYKALVLLVLLLFLLTSSALAGLEDFSLHWWTVDGGGGTSQGGIYALSYTIGQPDAGYSTGGDYTLTGGVAAGGAPAPLSKRLYLPLVLRD